MPAWLVRLTLDTRGFRDRATGLVDGPAVYRSLSPLVPQRAADDPGPRGLLYRVDSTHTVLAQTRTPPRLDALDPEIARTARPSELTGYLGTLATGDRVRYRITANAARRNGGNAEKARQDKLTVLHGEAADQWWRGKAADAGLRPLRIASTPAANILGAHGIRHGVTRFDGEAVVTEPDRLRAAVLGGIGRAKNYGCGLLSIAPADQPWLSVIRPRPSESSEKTRE